MATPDLFGKIANCSNCGQPIQIPNSIPVPSMPEMPVGVPFHPAYVQPAQPGESLGYVMVAIPCVAAFLLPIIGIPGIGGLLAMLVVLSTSIIAGVEGNQIGMGGPNDRDKKGRPGTHPVVWSVCMFLLWAFVFPAYLYARRRFGRKNLILPGIVATVVFVAELLFVN